MSFNTKLVIVGFTLVLLVASHGAAASFCEDTTGISCTSSNDTCEATCLNKTSSSDGRYIGGYCSSDSVCVCKKTCGGGGPPPPPSSSKTALRDEPAMVKPATATATGRRGLGVILN